YSLSYHASISPFSYTFFFFNDPATTAIYTLSLHDALPISGAQGRLVPHRGHRPPRRGGLLLHRRPVQGHDHPRRLQRVPPRAGGDRKSTRLNSSHVKISYAVFCLKKKKKKNDNKKNTNKTQ